MRPLGPRLALLPAGGLIAPLTWRLRALIVRREPFVENSSLLSPLLVSFLSLNHSNQL